MSAIAKDLPVSRPAVSQHLRVLLNARLVDVRQQGRERLYQARRDGLLRLRGELESYWSQSLDALKAAAEESYSGTASARPAQRQEERTDDHA